MIQETIELVDYIHSFKCSNLNATRLCRWTNVFLEDEEGKPLFPFHLRRECYHRSPELPHWHDDFWVMYIVRSGSGTRVINGHLYSIARGDIFLMAPHNAHHFRAPLNLIVDGLYFHREAWSPTEWQAFNALPELAAFLTPGLEAFSARHFTDHFGHLSPEPHAQVEATLAEIRRETKKDSLPYHLAARARVFTLLVQLATWRAEKTFVARPSRSTGIAEILSFCDNNFHRAISTDQLAEMMHFSRTHFCEVFAREVGMPPAAYIRHLRLQYAQKLLLETRHTIASIAHLSGFGDATQLGRAFKKTFGLSPVDYRQQHKSRVS